MARHIFYDSTGRVVQTNTGGHPETVAMATGLSYIEDDTPLWGEAWVEDGVLYQAPPQPSQIHTWDWGSRTWVANLSAARASKKASIERGRDAAMDAPISFQGLTLDADQQARTNIADKLQEIAQRRALAIPMPAELLVWLDAANQLHTFDSQDALAAWLGQLAIAIAERGTRAYAWSWTQKLACDQATDVASIDAVVDRI